MAFLNIGITLLLFVLAAAIPPANRRRGSMDNSRVFTAFPHAVAAFTSSNDTALKCSSATRTHFDPQAGRVSYAWHLKAHSGHPRRDIIFDVSFGPTPGEALVTVNNDTSRSFTALYEYSDYDNCVVAKIPYEGHQQCTLWVKKSLKHNIPRHCLDKYDESCDYRVPLIDRDICNDEDD
uniref:Lipocalin/cytosolic fatty-acid binding domain-containing protein n=1 Tax=Amblyomma maculatum TaxID=34609 RepID=G3MRL9_AMBMU